MLKLTNLNKDVKTIQGQSIADSTGTGLLTYKKALIGCCELHRPTKPAGSGEVLQVFGLGLKLNAATDECEVSMEELTVLKGVVEGSQVYVIAIVGQLLQYLNGIIEQKPEEKK